MDVESKSRRFTPRTLLYGIPGRVEIVNTKCVHILVVFFIINLNYKVNFMVNL